MNKQFFDTVGKRIRLLRQDLSLNQAALVSELKKQGIEIGSSYISELERSDKVPSGTVLAGLARVLGTTTDYLLLLTDDPNPPHEQEEQQIEDALARELLAVYMTLAADKKAMLLYLAKALAEPGKSAGA
jgi:transcriptional regulator with XRE-family HTH domain